MVRLSALVLLAIGLLTASCTSESDTTPDYRYRLTVEVETPEGLRSGSSVIEVRQSMGRPGSNPSGRMIFRHVSGEAVAVDLPGGRTLFALLRSEDNVDWAASVMQSVAPTIDGEPFEEQFDNVLLIEGERELPRYWPRLSNGDQYAAYPMFVTFGDLDDPTSVARVDPDDLAATFGEGYALRQLTVQLTEDPVTSGIDDRLEWLRSAASRSLDPDFAPTTDPTLSQTLNFLDLHKGPTS